MMSPTLVLCVALASVQAAGQEPATVPLPKPDTIETYTAKPSADGYEAEIVLPAGTEKPVTVAVMDAALEKTTVVVSTLDDPKDVPRKAVVRLKQKNLEARSYTMLLRVQRQKMPAEYTIRLAIPAVALAQLPAKVVFKQTTYFWGTGGSCWLGKCDASIPLSPVDPKAWLTNLKASPGPFLMDASATAGIIVPAISGSYDSPGAPVPTLTVKPGNGFRLGESTGSVRITADQLEPPVVLPVTVVNTLSSLLLLPALIAGLFFGFLTRTWLERRIGLRVLQVDASKLRAEVETRLKTNRDAPLKESLTALRTAVDRGFNAEASVLKDSLKQWQTDFQRALQQFEDDKAAFLKDAGELHAVVNRDYRLPPAFSDPVADAKERLTSLLALPGNNVADAKAKMEKIEKHLTEALRTAAQEHDVRWIEALDAVTRVRPFLMPDDTLRAEKELATITKEHAPVTEYVGASAPSRGQTQSMLESVHRTARLATDLPVQLGIALRRGIAALDSEMIDKGYGGGDSWKAWKARAEEIATALQHGDWHAGAAQAFELRNELVAVVRDLAGSLQTAPKTALIENLDANKFAAAMRQLPPADSIAGGPGTDAARPARAVPPGEFAVGLQKATEADAPPDTALPEPVPTVVAIEEELGRLKFLQRAALSVVIVLAGWGVLALSFTGESVQFASAFGWAFLSDITLEGAVAAVTPFKAKFQL